MDESVNKNGKMGGLWFCSINLFTNILIIVSLELCIETKYHTWINAVILLVITFISYIIFLIIVQQLTIFKSVGTVGVAFNSGRMWMNMIFVGGTCGIIDFFMISVEYVFFQNLTKKLQVLVNQGENLKLNNTENMPNIIKKKLDEYNQISQSEELVIQDENRSNVLKDENLNQQRDIINIREDQTDSEVINKIEINKADNKVNTFNVKKKELSKNDNYNKTDENNFINENDINKYNNEQDNNKIDNNDKLEIKKVNSIKNKNEEQPGSKDILINDKNSGNKNTNK